MVSRHQPRAGLKTKRLEQRPNDETVFQAAKEYRR
jgi:hypothetical protein